MEVEGGRGKGGGSKVAPEVVELEDHDGPSPKVGCEGSRRGGRCRREEEEGGVDVMGMELRERAASGSAGSCGGEGVIRGRRVERRIETGRFRRMV